MLQLNEFTLFPTLGSGRKHTADKEYANRFLIYTIRIVVSIVHMYTNYIHSHKLIH